MVSIVVRATQVVLLSIWMGTFAVADERLSYNKDVQPILARHCYACHGPDAQAREAKLRLDQRVAALAELPSGATAIVPGKLKLSELASRISEKGEDRMPPEERPALSDKEIQTLRQWIEQGASWSRHWAFEPLSQSTIEANSDGGQNYIDDHLLQTGVRLEARARRETLLRRVYLDMIGLPPSVEQVSQFLSNERPDAYARVVDSLLASPRYGERWGRHWLDVARYADSNGGDENHAYPLAHRYRDYVIDALNRDTPFDVFVKEQLAGDLLPLDPADTELRVRRVAATGYLAIGMKILAERDPVKKQADIVDEQIDTFGRTFLGLSLGCARCHDHKFDPITAEDYYALAGVFHSTKIVDLEISSGEFQQQTAAREAKRQAAEKEIAALEARLNRAVVVERQAELFDRGNVVVDKDQYGKGIGIISDPGGQNNFAEYDLEIPADGEFYIELRYAAKMARPGRILIDGNVVNDKAISQVTGSWFPETQTWHSEGLVSMTPGRHVLRIESEPMMSHIDRWRLLKSDVEPSLLLALKTQRERLRKLSDKKQDVPKAMAVQDDNVRDIKFHRRGSHVDLGDQVQRGGIRSLGAAQFAIGESQSGRLQLAQWLTSDKSPISALTARVMVNRVWHWHFGKGLVGSTDDFGLRGEVPSHPLLLDALAADFIRHNWSLKLLHRQILLSRTYQQVRRSGKENRATSLFATKRLEPEVVRDSMLAVSGALDLKMFRAPMQVKSQDPSPTDAESNQEFYDNSRRRSVYLPIVRSNVYNYLTLFDFPNVATPVGRRDETIVPTQALWFLNSGFIERISRTLAERVSAANIVDERETLELVFRQILSRRPSSSELSVLEESLLIFRESSQEAEPENRQEDAWSMLIQTLFMSGEALDVP